MSTSVSQNESQNEAQSEAQSESQLSSPRHGQRNRKSIRNWGTAAGMILVLLVGIFVIRTQGHVSGVEFAPSHFQTRQFSFYEIPLLQLQITPIYRKTTTNKTATYLRQKSLIQSTRGPAQTWHLVSLSRGLTGSTAADASFLIDQLELSSAGKDYWRQWSIDHPAKATLVWPIIQKLADRELYVLIPGLLELVSADSSKPATGIEMLKRDIDTYLQDEYLSLIGDMAAADRQRLAAALLSEARSDYPKNADLQTIQNENPDWANLLDEVDTPRSITQ